MSCLYNCGVCCMLLSIWAVIQLVFMGIFYKIEAVPLVNDVIEHEYENYQELIIKTTLNYHKVAMNCWIAAAIYLAFIVLSIGCIMKASADDKKRAQALDDDDIVCGPLELDKPKKRRKGSMPLPSSTALPNVKPVSKQI